MSATIDSSPGPAESTTFVSYLAYQLFDQARYGEALMVIAYMNTSGRVKALAAELARKFKLPWEFIGTDNPL